MTEPLRLCTHNCRVPYYENCPACAGLGVFGPKNLPVWAFEAMDGPPPPDCRPCLVCGSTTQGVPMIAVPPTEETPR